MGIIQTIVEGIFPFRKKILFRAFQGGAQFLIALMMAGLGWSFGHYIFRAIGFSLFDGWEKFLPEYTEGITSDVLLEWFDWYQLDVAAKFLGMWCSFNHGNFHMYNYLYLVRLKRTHQRKFKQALKDHPQFTEWPYTVVDAVYVVIYLVFDFILPFIVMLFSIYVIASIGSRVAFISWVQWAGAVVLPFLALVMYTYTQSIVRAAFHYERLEAEVGENFDSSDW